MLGKNVVDSWDSELPIGSFEGYRPSDSSKIERIDD